MEWRVTGVRRWIPVLLLVTLAANTSRSIARLASGAPSRPGDPRWLDLVFALGGAAFAVVVVGLVVVTWRTRVTLSLAGIEVLGGRARTYPYDQITRVYRDRWTSGAVSLALTGDRTVRLPAPVAGLGTAGEEIDEAVRQIRARLPGDAGEHPTA